MTSETAPTLEDIEDDVARLCGQINHLVGQVVEACAGVVDGGHLGSTGCRSLAQWIAWRTGWTPARAREIAVLVDRRADLPRLTAALQEGTISSDQAATVATRITPTPELDAHYAEMALVMTVPQLRTAIRAAVPAPEPPPACDPSMDRHRQLSFGYTDDGCWRATIRADALVGAEIETALRIHRDALIADRDRDQDDQRPGDASGSDEDPAPFPTWFDALERLVDRSLDRAAADRPHHLRTRVMVHVDAADGSSAIHLGPALTARQRAEVTCDGVLATVLERDGSAVSVGRDHRITPPKTRAIVEQRATEDA